MTDLETALAFHSGEAAAYLEVNAFNWNEGKKETATHFGPATTIEIGDLHLTDSLTGITIKLSRSEFLANINRDGHNWRGVCRFDIWFRRPWDSCEWHGSFVNGYTCCQGFTMKRKVGGFLGADEFNRGPDRRPSIQITPFQGQPMWRYSYPKHIRKHPKTVAFYQGAWRTAESPERIIADHALARILDLAA